MVEARDLIARAVALKPNAHFGREKYQLKAMDWIIRPPQVASDAHSLPSLLNVGPIDPPSEAIEGLCGLIVLGNAWESVDIFNALAQSLENYGETDLACQTRLRCAELADAGRQSLLPGAPRGEALTAIFHAEAGSLARGPHLAALRASYSVARGQGEDRQARRTAFMLARLAEGRHPDTDATFWNEQGQTFVGGARSEDGEPGAVIPAVQVHVVTRPVDPWWYHPRWALALMAAASLIAGSVGLALRQHARRSRKPVPVDVEWL